MKNLFYLSGVIAFAIISLHFVTIQIKSNSETCKYLAEQVDNFIKMADISELKSDGSAEFSPQELRVEVTKRAKRYSEIYNDYCKF